jgi:hypothetical protein
MFYHARYYAPAIGRFVQADTIIPNPDFPQDFNRYSYVRNNPLKYTDPGGHDCLIIDDDEHCSDRLPAHHSLPPVDSPSWGKLSEEEQILAYEAYLRFRENPDYYRSLYWSDPQALTYLKLWARYAENQEIDMYLGIDTVGEATIRLDGLEEQWANGEINDEEFG